MNILNTHIHQLRFYIDKDLSSEYIKRWNEFKSKCENGENKHIVEQLKSYCKLNINRDLPYLKREEGGLGGNDNLVNKQIKFRDYWGDNDYRYKRDNDIILHEITSTDNEKWTYYELDDLLRAFIKAANFNLKGDCINGCIEMFNKKMLDDYYLESDSE
tara:strand:- start:61 stop:537 length:477 start_codon:yes stop_codon:yes gene_type:complete